LGVLRTYVCDDFCWKVGEDHFVEHDGEDDKVFVDELRKGDEWRQGTRMEEVVHVSLPIRPGLMDSMRLNPF
jgi:hypothetical protein